MRPRYIQCRHQWYGRGCPGYRPVHGGRYSVPVRRRTVAQCRPASVGGGLAQDPGGRHGRAGGRSIIAASCCFRWAGQPGSELSLARVSSGRQALCRQYSIGDRSHSVTTACLALCVSAGGSRSVRPVHRCPVCGKAFLHPKSLLQHLPVHTGSTTCPVCGRVCDRKARLNLHMRSCHPEYRGYPGSGGGGGAARGWPTP